MVFFDFVANLADYHVFCKIARTPFYFTDEVCRPNILYLLRTLEVEEEFPTGHHVGGILFAEHQGQKTKASCC